MGGREGREGSGLLRLLLRSTTYDYDQKKLARKKKEKKT